MIDVHIHLLPGVDDGAADLEESVAMCRTALEDGCEALVATPHQSHPEWENRDAAHLEALLQEVQIACGGTPELFLGAEIRVGHDLLDAVTDLERSNLVPLAGSSYLLLELEVDTPPQQVVELVHELCVAGWQPIIAHPEFISSLSGDLDAMARIARAGGRFQVTAMSLTGGFGGRIRRLTRRMLKAQLVDFVASDAHRATWRPPGLHRAFEEIATLRDRDTAELLTLGNPRAVLEDQPLAA